MKPSKVLDHAARALRGGDWRPLVAVYAALDVNGPRGPFYGPTDLHALLCGDERFQVTGWPPGAACVRLRDLRLARALVAEARYSVDGWLKLETLRHLASRRLGRPVSLHEASAEVCADPVRFELCYWTDGLPWVRATYRHGA